MNNRIKHLFKRIRKRDKNAACELIQIFYEDIYAYLRRLCSCRTDAEDLTQQTFLKVWSSLDGFASRSKFSTWLYRIAYNTFVDFKRSNAACAKSNLHQWWHECPDTNPGPYANTAERQLVQRLYKAVDLLDDDKKHVVHLHYYQGLSIRETAKVLEIATSTVKYRLREVLKILRKKLDTEENEYRQKQTIPITKGKVI